MEDLNSFNWELNTTDTDRSPTQRLQLAFISSAYRGVINIDFIIGYITEKASEMREDAEDSIQATS